MLIEHARVALADACAQSLGVRRGFARAYALALAPQLVCLTPDAARERRAFEAVALALCAYTPQIVLADAYTIVLDVSASLRLFGGLRALWRRLAATLDASGHAAALACAPTPWAAWLFAQARVVDRRGRRVVKFARLASMLDALPALLLPAAADHRDGLAQIGCDTLGAVRRLPRAGVTRRFGPGLLDTLARTYGEAADPRTYFEPPPVFGARLELMARVEHADALLFAVRRLLLQLVGWLTARHAGVSRFTLTLVHETARRGDPRMSTLTVAWSAPARDLDHLVLMSREKLDRTELAAPVIELHLHADEITDYAAPTDTLFPLDAGPDAGREAMTRLLERLVARLGADKVREVGARADHRPEAAITDASYTMRRPARTAQARIAQEGAMPIHRGQASTRQASTGQARTAQASTVQARADRVVSSASASAQRAGASSQGKRRRLNGRLDGPHDLVPPHAPVAPRPVWLLPEPLRLATREGQPYYRSAMRIVSGPECIETGWWDGPGARRDYFVASGDDATLYWIYRERTPSETHDAAWFLQGMFG
ncbi:Y-family DNA polymerase [Pararobbsia silviterrae]|uniref:Y-family DNA polymerase n=1 Tax=Pararobbsia silviterrae TaxID=1792498 RepID=UPI003B82D7CD